MRIGIDIDDVITDTSITMKDYIIKHDKNGEIIAHIEEIMRGDPSTPNVEKFCIDNYIKIFKTVKLKENASEVMRSIIKQRS
jgi:hypothetical protein